MEVPRPSPLPPLSPFSHIRSIVRDSDEKDNPLTEEIVKKIQRVRGPY